MSTNCISCVVNDRTGTDLLCDQCRAVKLLSDMTDWPNLPSLDQKHKEALHTLLTEREILLQGIQEAKEFVKDYHFLRCSCRMSNVNGGMAYIVKGIGDNLTPSKIRSARLKGKST